jgi:hypothetical protein
VVKQDIWQQGVGVVYTLYVVAGRRLRLHGLCGNRAQSVVHGICGKRVQSVVTRDMC